MVSQEEQWSDIESALYATRPLTRAPVVLRADRTSLKAVTAFLLALLGLVTSLAAWLFFYIPLLAVGLGLAAFVGDFPKGRTGRKWAILAIVLGSLESVVVVLTSIAASHYPNY